MSNRALSHAVLLLACAIASGCNSHTRATQNRSPSTETLSTRPLYPSVARSNVVDDYHGNKIADPYRALESDDAPETRRFIEAENKLTRNFLDGPLREKIRSQIANRLNFPKYSSPRHEGNFDIFEKNDGLQNQSVVYSTHSLTDEPRVLIDPNKLSKDGTIALNDTEFTHDGSLMAYALSSGGSDQSEIHVRRVADSVDLPDVLHNCKFASVAWKLDNSGFWYNRFPDSATVPADQQTLNNKLFWHALGAAQEKDSLVYTPPDADLSAAPGITDDGEYLIVYSVRGTSPKTRINFRRASEAGEFHPLFIAEDASYEFIEHDGKTFYIVTDLDTPRHRIIAVNSDHPADIKTIIPQSDDAIESVACVGNKFVVDYLHDAHTVIKLFDMNGKFERDLPLPGIGAVFDITGKRVDHEMFFSFTSFIDPPTVYRYDLDTNRLSVFRRPTINFDSSKFATRQVFVTSKDGTRVPMFITQRKDLKNDGLNPTILYGYGGFDVNITPDFSTSRTLWLDHGGVFCQASIRGGGEYGEAWHEAGMLAKKQNVFDDFEACAQWLIDQKITNAKNLAIQGGSNGGLLVAACEVQRPNLFGAVLCQVPLTDMLRYQQFTVGRFWIPEYGDATASEKEFETLRAYSPLQNVKDGTSYPPTLIFTADGDDRVAPLHARKFAAALQAAQSGTNPILLRIESRAGHGGGMPTSKAIDENADVYTFLSRVFHVEWK